MQQFSQNQSDFDAIFRKETESENHFEVKNAGAVPLFLNAILCDVNNSLGFLQFVHHCQTTGFTCLALPGIFLSSSLTCWNPVFALL